MIDELEYGTDVSESDDTYTVFFVAKAKKCFDKFNLQYVVIPGVGGWKYVWWYFMAKN